MQQTAFSLPVDESCVHDSRRECPFCLIYCCATFNVKGKPENWSVNSRKHHGGQWKCNGNSLTCTVCLSNMVQTSFWKLSERCMDDDGEYFVVACHCIVPAKALKLVGPPGCHISVTVDRSLLELESIHLWLLKSHLSPEWMPIEAFSITKCWWGFLCSGKGSSDNLCMYM